MKDAKELRAWLPCKLSLSRVEKTMEEITSPKKKVGGRVVEEETGDKSDSHCHRCNTSAGRGR